jgi:hypothetical protein
MIERVDPDDSSELTCEITGIDPQTIVGLMSCCPTCVTRISLWGILAQAPCVEMHRSKVDDVYLVSKGIKREIRNEAVVGEEDGLKVGADVCESK